MSTLISASNLSKRYGRKPALDGVDLRVDAGEVVGLIGPNGAGKSTLLRCLLGMTRYRGELTVLGRSPRSDRSRMLRAVSYIADVASLPEWISVRRLLRFLDGVHPRFDTARAREFLARTEVRLDQRVGTLSKGMKTQLHLALILGVDSRLLILDEPTLGLDVIFRSEFYDTLVDRYLSAERAILLTTHQVEEIEDYLTRVVFINDGRLLLDLPVAQIGAHYQTLVVGDDRLGHALRLEPLYQRKRAHDHLLIFRRRDEAELAALGEIRAPSLTELFIAVVKEGGA